MEFEEIVKRLEWLDTQQRQNKEMLAKLDERLSSFETTVNAVSKQIKSINKQMTDIAPAAKRLEQFETLLSKQRTDILKLIEENEKDRLRIERETTKRTQAQMDDLNKTLTELKVATTSQDAKFKERASSIDRMSNNINDLKSLVDESVRSNENILHSFKAIDETRKNDLKRIADIQGDITSLRKRLDENREKGALNADGIRNMENRFAELLASETERRQAQAAFLEQQALGQLDRDHAWKDWKEKYDIFLKEASTLDSQVQTLDETMRGAKKAQDTYLDLNTKLERRISEVTEMQRLAEDRLRQEWISFKTDDQKRWTGYSLSSEESLRDIRKDMQKVEERTTTLGDVAQVLQDQMHQTTDTTEQQLQELMNVVHGWMTSYQRIMGHGKKTKKQN
jgi:chromosome segregation ATPase